MHRTSKGVSVVGMFEMSFKVLHEGCNWPCLYQKAYTIWSICKVDHPCLAKIYQVCSAQPLKGLFTSCIGRTRTLSQVGFNNQDMWSAKSKKVLFFQWRINFPCCNCWVEHFRIRIVWLHFFVFCIKQAWRSMCPFCYIATLPGTRFNNVDPFGGIKFTCFCNKIRKNVKVCLFRWKRAIAKSWPGGKTTKRSI